MDGKPPQRRRRWVNPCGASLSGRQRKAGSLFAGTTPIYGALDLGTNNCRLLIARPDHEGFRVIDAFSRIVRLGEGLSASGRLSEAAMARTIEALKVCAEKIARRRVSTLRSVATQACRSAANCSAFVDRVREETGLALDIITAREEARLAVIGCSSLLLPEARDALVFDIGGGSTELIWVRHAAGALDIAAWTSLPFGVVNLAERFGTGVIAPQTYQHMVGHVRAALADFAALCPAFHAAPSGEAQLLGTAGTVTTLASLHLGLEAYDRRQVDGSWLEAAGVRALSRRLAAMSIAARAANPCIGRERADLVVAGCAILEAILDEWPMARLRVADRGIREGILRGLMQGVAGAAS
ncbi:MAG: Ppx/GppA phosphatase family protein [Pseudomonadota bacterium]